MNDYVNFEMNKVTILVDVTNSLFYFCEKKKKIPTNDPTFLISSIFSISH